MTDGATLSAAGKQLDLSLVEASEGNNGYDISALLKETGNVTLDGGFTNTASCTRPAMLSTIPKIRACAAVMRASGSGRSRVRRINLSDSRSHTWLSAEAPPATSAVPTSV